MLNKGAVVAVYRLFASGDGATHIESLDVAGLAFEGGPAEFKGIGGAVLGTASRVLLMRFEPGADAPLHRANPGLVVLLEGELMVAVSDGAEAHLRPGDAVRVESMGGGGWAPSNPGSAPALLALTQMPPST